ncbi:MAG: hypothetical protein WA821_07755 [Anaerolineales bacterium]
MTDTERQQVLKMVEDGKITAEEGLKLMQALDEDTATEELDVVETGPGGEAAGEAKSDPEFDHRIGRFRRLWVIPLSAGILLTVLSAWWMYAALQSSGLGFWFYCACLPFALGVAVVALGFDSRTSRWIYVNVLQKPGESPQRIVISFPLSPVSWLVSLFGNFIPVEQKGAVEDVMQAIFKSTKSDEPLFVDVHDEDGQHVQVYIG